MSSYNDNLHSSVVSSLSAQELELQKVKSKQDASMFSLYYAQGARITASEKLEVTSEKYSFEQKTNGQATVDSNISTNVLAAANNAKTYTDKSVTNTSVAASNMQIATNAIVKLSSDTGSILSMVSAGDFGTEIYTQAKNAAILMDNTAYIAEVTSQKSMESSASISEVSTNTLVDKATTTDTSIKDLLAVISSELEATNTMVQTEISNVATANTDEKKAEGELEDFSVSYKATLDAYKMSNSQLNLNLTVLTSNTHNKFTASFNTYKNPFYIETDATDNKSTAAKSPVESYYVMLVKESKKQTFAINNAETIINNGATQSFVKIDPIAARRGEISQTIYIAQPKTTTDNIKILHDTDGNEFKLGESYVIFVLTVFTTEYKKAINTFDDYLSAASMMFTMKHSLNKPNADTINVTKTDDAYQKLEFNILQKLEFNFEFNKPEKTKINVAYRCIFLPDNSKLIDGLLTTSDLQKIEKDIEYDELIANYNYEIYDLEQQNKFLKGKKSENNNGTKEGNTKDIDAKIKYNEAEIAKLQKKLKNAEKNSDSNDQYKPVPGFFFNSTIAEQIPTGSYTNGTVKSISATNYLLNKYPDLEKETKDEDIKKLDNAIKKYIRDFISGKSFIVLILDFQKLLKQLIKVEKKLEALLKNESLMNDFGKIITGYTPFAVSMVFAPETTDNFGNRLIGNNSYIPAILVVSDTTETKEKMFKNTLSNFSKTDSFTYTAISQGNSYKATNELVNNQPQKCNK